MNKYSEALGFKLHQSQRSFQNVPVRPYALDDRAHSTVSQRMLMANIEKSIITHADIVSYNNGMCICIVLSTDEKVKVSCPVLWDRERNEWVVNWVVIAFFTPRLFRSICNTHKLNGVYVEL